MSVIVKVLNNEKIIKNKIVKELVKLNYNFNLSGTDYLIEAIYLLYSSKMYYNFSLEKDVYPVIANMNGDFANNIKFNIVYATDSMFYDCEEEILMKYIGSYENSKSGPKKIIRAVLKRLK